MQILVTGAAGFIGSHLCERLLADGHAVRGIDNFTDYYDPASKRRNIEPLETMPEFELLPLDLGSDRLDEAVDGVELIFHQAGQPGVRLSWADGFRTYAERNIVATQRLLEATKQHRNLRRLVFASSSSVYGNLDTYPTSESELPRPFSPYGVTKLASEHLCSAYGENFGVPTVSLRYFTVYGPRQRPDMAFHRLIEAGLRGTSFPAYGDGSQIRSFTFVDDVVEANIAAASADLEPGQVFNISGGSSLAMNEVYDLAASLLGAPIARDVHEPKSGDVHRTGGAIEKAEQHLGWTPKTDIETGLAAQVAWHREVDLG